MRCWRDVCLWKRCRDGEFWGFASGWFGERKSMVKGWGLKMEDFVCTGSEKWMRAEKKQYGTSNFKMG